MKVLATILLIALLLALRLHVIAMMVFISFAWKGL